MTNSKINRKRQVIALRTMFKNADSIEAVARVKSSCHAYQVKFHLLSLDDATFERAMDERFNQIDQFFKKIKI